MRQSDTFRFFLHLTGPTAIGLLLFCLASGAATINLINGESLTGEIIGENEIAITLRVGTVPVPLLKSEIVSVIDNEGKVRVIDHSRLPKPAPDLPGETDDSTSDEADVALAPDSESTRPTLKPVEELEVVHEVRSSLPILLPEGNSYRIDASLLNIRKGPGTDFDRITALQTGAVVVELEKVNDWIRIRTPDGMTGWVFERYLQPLQDEPVVCTAEQVNFREGPGLNRALLRKLAPQEVLLLLDTRDDGWVQLRDSEGVVGWAYGQYIARVADRDDLKPDYRIHESPAPNVRLAFEPVEPTNNRRVVLEIGTMDWLHGGKISLLLLARDTVSSDWTNLIQGADITRKFNRQGKDAAQWFGLGPDLSAETHAAMLVNLKGQQKNSDWVFEFRLVPQPLQEIRTYLVGQSGAKRAMLLPLTLPLSTATSD